MKDSKILGLMSGSSCDGVDAAVCSFRMHDGNLSYKLLETASFKFEDDLSLELKHAASSSAKSLNEIESKFSKFLTAQINQQFGHSQIDYIASHGHTVLHSPADGYTVQLGSGSLIAEGTGVKTICDFRSKDIACGGQGAPLAPLADKYLFAGNDFYLNLGGIVNISYVGADKIIGYDISPCNQMLNALSSKLGKPYDDKGLEAAAGTIHTRLLDQLLSNDYLTQTYPKSLDNSWVQDNYTSPLVDHDETIQNKLCTAVEFIAICISNDLKLISKNEKIELTGKNLFCTGGGAFNDFMISRIKFHCSKLGVHTVLPADTIIEYKEAMLMSLMGYLRVQNKPNCIASVTGATKDCSGGVIYHP